MILSEKNLWRSIFELLLFFSAQMENKIQCEKKLFNSSDVGTSLYGVVCRKFHMSLLHDYSSCMVIPRQFQGQF